MEKFRCLFVDDDPDTLMVVSKLLADHYEVVIAHLLRMARVCPHCLARAMIDLGQTSTRLRRCAFALRNYARAFYVAEWELCQIEFGGLLRIGDSFFKCGLQFFINLIRNLYTG